MKGTPGIVDVPSKSKLNELTASVIENNFSFNLASSEQFKWKKDNPVPLYPGGKSSPVKHIVFISKEKK